MKGLRNRVWKMVARKDRGDSANWRALLKDSASSECVQSLGQ
jgi:hypothetical protein